MKRVYFQLCLALLLSNFPVLLSQGNLLDINPHSPAIEGLVLPDVELITPANAGSLEEIARIGQGRATDVFLSSDSSELALLTNLGIYFYSVDDFLANEYPVPVKYFDLGGRISTIAFSHKWDYFVAAHFNGDITVHNVADGTVIQRLEESNMAITSLAISSSDDLLVAASIEGDLFYWDMNQHKLLSEENTQGSISKIALAPNGNLLAVGNFGNSVTLWDVKTGKKAAEFSDFLQHEVHTDEIFAITFSPDGKYLLAAAGDEAVYIWDVETKEEFKVIGIFDNWIYDVDFSPDGEQLAITSYSNIHYIDTKTWSYISNTPSQTVQFIYIGDGKTNLRLINAQNKAWRLAIYGNGTDPIKYIQPTGMVHNFAFSPSGTDISAVGRDYLVRNWSLSNLSIFRLDQWGPIQIVYSPDEKYVVHGNLILDIGTGEKRKVLGDGAKSAAFSDDGSMLAFVDSASQIRVLDTSNYRIIKIIKRLDQDDHDLERERFKIAISPDNARLLVAAHYGIEIYSLPDGELLQKIEEFNGPVKDIEFSPDGKSLASGSYDGTLKLWTADRYELIKVLNSSPEAISGLSFSPDGLLIAAGFWNGTLRVWQVEQDMPPTILSGHREMVTDVEFSPNGQLLASSSWDGSIRVWGVLK